MRITQIADPLDLAFAALQGVGLDQFDDGTDADDLFDAAADAFFQCGDFAGTSIVKHVKVINKNVTGIKNVKAQKVADGARYNLAGQKVGAAYKGIVIQNGKKILVK